MKKLLLTSLCALAAFASVNAETITVDGKSGRAQVLNTDPSNDLVLNSASSDAYKIDYNKSATYKTVTAVNGDALGNVRFAIGTLIIDANTAEGDIDVLKANQWKMNLFDLVFKNSAENNTANMKVTVKRFVVQTDVGQSQSMTFDAGKYTVKADTYDPEKEGNGSVFMVDSEGRTSKLTVKAGADVTWSGRVTFGKNGIFDIYGKYSNSSIKLDGGSKMTIYNGAHLYLSAGTGLIVSGNLDVKAGAKFETVAGSHLKNHTGTITTAADMILHAVDNSTGKYVQTAGSTKFKRYAEINAGADWTVYEKVMLEGDINNGATQDAWLAKLTINEGSNFVIKNNENGNPGNAARVLFYGANNLILNKENALVDEKGEAVKLATVGGFAFNKMTINANQVFKTLFLAKQADLDIVLADGVKLTFEGFNTTDKSSYLHIYNFQEDSVLLQNVSNVETIESQIKLYGATADEFLGFAKVNDAGFLTLITTTVPEPAEWAMIFGALALGLAVYRRRK